MVGTSLLTAHSSLFVGRGALASYTRAGANQRFCWRFDVGHEHDPAKPVIIQFDHWPRRSMDEQQSRSGPVPISRQEISARTPCQINDPVRFLRPRQLN